MSRQQTSTMLCSLHEHALLVFDFWEVPMKSFSNWQYCCQQTCFCNSSQCVTSFFHISAFVKVPNLLVL